jgi:hypothetical protein
LVITCLPELIFDLDLSGGLITMASLGGIDREGGASAVVGSTAPFPRAGITRDGEIPMSDEPRENLDALRGMATQLNAATTEAGMVVHAVDHFLSEELGVGVAAATRPFDSQRALGEDDRELVVTTHLAFGRVQGKERLYVLRATLEKNEWKENFTKIVGEERIAWSACSRELKLQSFVMLPELLGNLAVRVEEVANQTSKTTAIVRELIDAMKQPPPRQLDRESDQDAEPTPLGEGGSEPEDIPLHELSVSAAPDLFKRPRPR